MKESLLMEKIAVLDNLVEKYKAVKEILLLSRDEIVKLNARLDGFDERLPSAIQEVVSVHDFVTENPLAIVDFFGEWCVPCFSAEAPLERVARKGEVAVGRLDVDAHPDEAKEYGAEAIPLLVAFQNGKPVQRMEGIPTKREKAFDMIRFMAQRLKVPSYEFERTLRWVRAVAKMKGWELVPDQGQMNGLVAALTYNRLNYKKPYCPCKTQRIPENVCPCRPVQGTYPGSDTRIQEKGRCYCGLFWRPDFVRKVEAEMRKVNYP